VSVRDELVAAFEANDHEAIKAAGWWPVWEMCHTAWAPRQTATAKEMVPYAKLLGDLDPAAVLEALEACAGEWRPVPGQLRGHLNAKDCQSSVDVARGRDLTATTEALQAVADAIRGGEQPCSCDYHSPQWRRDDAYVLRCPTCNGLETGQVYAVEDREAA
jgi:hypothetical protein